MRCLSGARLLLGAVPAVLIIEQNPHPLKRLLNHSPPRNSTVSGHRLGQIRRLTLARRWENRLPARRATAATGSGRKGGSCRRPRQLVGGKGEAGANVIDCQFWKLGQ